MIILTRVPISYFKTIYSAYIDTAILGMLYVLLYIAASCYLHYITNYSNAIHPIRTEHNGRKKIFLVVSMLDTSYCF